MKSAYTGPLDIARHINQEAIGLDPLVLEYSNSTNEDQADLHGMLSALENQHPYFNRSQVVRVYGTVLSDGLSDDGEVKPLVAISPESRERSEDTGGFEPYNEERSYALNYAEGIYYGYAIRPVYDPETEEVTEKVVHMVKTGSYSYWDSRYQYHAIQTFDYVCAEGSEVVPVRPLEAHSLEDLKDDELIADLDVIAFRETGSRTDRVRQAVRLLNNGLREDLDKRLSQQRTSYLNSLGLHDGVRVLVKDFIVVSSVGDYAKAPKETAYSDLTVPILFEPSHWEFAPSYKRPENEPAFVVGGPNELFAAATTEDGQLLLAPAAKVVGMQAVAHA